MFHSNSCNGQGFSCLKRTKNLTKHHVFLPDLTFRSAIIARLFAGGIADKNYC